MTAAFPGWDRSDPAFGRITTALFAAGFAVFAQVFGVQAVLPALSEDLDVSASDAALAVSTTTLGVAASVLPWAWASDRFGRVAVMRVSIVAATLLGIAGPLLPSFDAVLVARFVLGLAIGAVPGVTIAYLAEELRPGRVAVAAGIFVAGNTFGGICGRLLGGYVADVAGWRWALGAITATAAVAAVVFLVRIPPPRGFHGSGAARRPLRTRILIQLRDPVMLALYTQGLLLMGAFGAVYNFLTFRLLEPAYGVPAALVSLVFLAYLFGTGASRVSGLLALRLGTLRTLLLGQAVMVAGLLLLLVPTLPAALVGLVVFTIGCFTSHPVASAQSGVRPRIGRAQSTALYQLSWLGGTALFGWLIGVVYDAHGWDAAVWAIAGLCALAALIAVVGLGILKDRRPSVP